MLLKIVIAFLCICAYVLFVLVMFNHTASVQLYCDISGGTASAATAANQTLFALHDTIQRESFLVHPRLLRLVNLAFDDTRSHCRSLQLHTFYSNVRSDIALHFNSANYTFIAAVTYRHVLPLRADSRFLSPYLNISAPILDGILQMKYLDSPSLIGLPSAPDDKLRLRMDVDHHLITQLKNTFEAHEQTVQHTAATQQHVSPERVIVGLVQRLFQFFDK